MRLVDGVYALPTTLSLPDRDVTIHPSAVETDDGLILIDAGFPDTVDLLADALGEHGFALDDVAHVLLTHQDGDHAGGLSDVLDATDATTFAHLEDTPAIEGDRTPLKSGDDDRYPPAPIDVTGRRYGDVPHDGWPAPSRRNARSRLAFPPRA